MANDFFKDKVNFKGSMGAIFAVMKLNSSPCGVHYRERASEHPHCSPAKRDLEDPEGQLSLLLEMAGLFSLRMLLLWAGLIGLANCQSATDVSSSSPPRIPSVNNESVTSSPPHTMTSGTQTTDLKPPLTLPTPNSLPSNQTYNSTTTSATTPTPTPKTSIQAVSQNQSSPAVTLPTTTVPSTTQACSYTVTPIKFGFQIDIKSSTPRNYTININEEGRPDTGKNITVHQSSQSSSHEIKHLKPCTEYEHYVTHLDGAGEKHCSHTEDKTKTTDISKDDIESMSASNPWHCFVTGVTGTSALYYQPQMSVRYFTTKFTPRKVVPTTSFSSTKSFIPVDFLNASEIHQIVSTKLPVKIETKLPPNCKNLSVDYTCRESGRVTEPKLESQLESELEPFTDYSCTGQIKDNNVTIKNTTAVYVRIDCDFNIIATKNRVTNTSIGLSWSTTSDKCQEVLHELDKLSYDCSCGPTPSHQTHRSKAKPSGGTCLVSGLEPFTTYTCGVKPIYNNTETDAKQTPVTQVTEAGIPDDIKDLRTSEPEHNVIIVTCIHSGKFKGHTDEKRYRAELHHGGVIVKELKEKECKFEFRDLSYSTTYTVKVIAFNTELESRPKTKEVSTFYSDKAVIGFLVFLFITITSVVVSVLVYMIYTKTCRKSRNDVNEDVMLESTAIYVNVPTPGWHH
ncbi:receptor-type tyrosine-protein phosphatase C-like [Seriola dumerili]|uniref:receptor-type tyrosine-protein phosphatase C-like n=1 Tax=Seriola dumerili TaxID=41447 RepID=UPI000BBE9054|nr:receptor-type tyrosine-protein phosphatase C-like [Seriola dumerili]